MARGAQRRLDELVQRRDRLAHGQRDGDAVAAELAALDHDITLAQKELDDVIDAARERARRLDELSSDGRGQAPASSSSSASDSTS